MSRRSKMAKAQYDIVVIGGGLSGMCAAISAARHGAKTALIHGRHVFGGNASSEIRMHVCGASESMAKPDLEEGGILYELMLENKSRNDYFNFSIWDMVLFSAIKKEPNLTAYLNTVMEDCEMNGNTIKSISAYQHTTETRWTIEGNIFIDCTGNGTLGYLAGAEYRTGSEGKEEFQEPHAPDFPNNNRMGNTLLFKAVDRGHSVHFKRPEFARKFTEEELKYRTHSAVHEAKTKEGADKAYLHITAFSTSSVDYGYWWLELTGEKEDIIDEYEEIRDELVSCVYGIWDHLKNGGEHGAENYDLEWVGMLPGMRESRRLVGDYVLNENDALIEKESVTTQELSAKLFISVPTLRRDLIKLEQMGKIIRTHGGAQLIKKSADEKIPIFLREQEQNDAKEIMARKAVEFVRDGDTIMLDGSTSAYSIIPHLASFKNLIVITSSAKSSFLLGRMGISNICTGGRMITRSLSYVGEDAENTVKRYNADVVFFSCRGLSADGKLTDNSIEENCLRRTMLQHAKKKVFLCDSSKFGRTYFNNLCHLSEVDEIVCEKILPVHLYKMLK